MGKNSINLDLFYEIEIRDINGKVTSKFRRHSKSLLKLFALALKSALSGTAANQTLGFSALDTSNVSRTFYTGLASNYWTFMAAQAPTATDAFGIQIGRSTTPVTRDDFMLQNKCTHGTGTNQFWYGAITVEDVAGVAPSSTFRIIRTFTNNSGFSIVDVNELGLVILNWYGGVGTFYFLIARDVFGSPITVPNGSTMTVRYIFSVTA